MKNAAVALSHAGPNMPSTKPIATDRNHSAGALKTLLSPPMVAGSLVGLGCAVSLGLNWPGQLSYDSVMQLHDGRTGHYNPWHPPVMAWMLGVADWLVPGTGLFILFDTLLFSACLFSIPWLAPRSSWRVVPMAAILVALPQFVLYQGIVWKDVLFADVAVAGFLLLAGAAACWQRACLRWVLIGISFLFFVLATLVRQNGVVALAFGVIALVFIGQNNSLGWLKAIACALVAALAAACLVSAATFALQIRTGGSSGTPGQIKLLQLYDLIGIVKTDPSIRLDALARASPELEELIRSDGVRLYTPMRNDTLAGSAELQRAFVFTTAAAIAEQWRDTVGGHPLDYLRVRERVFRWTLFTPDLVQCNAWYTGVTGRPRYLHDLGIERRSRSQDRILANYSALFVSTPVFSHAAFAGLSIVLLVFLSRRRRGADLAIAAMLAGALAFAASFFVISIACDYRYLLFLDLAALIGVFYSAATWAD